jgi:hypothetical protein
VTAGVRVRMFASLPLFVTNGLTTVLPQLFTVTPDL